MNALWPVALLALVAFGGCVDTIQEYYDFDADEHYRNPGVFPGSYAYAEGGSTVLQPGLLTHAGPEVIRLESRIPAYPVDGEGEADSKVTITMAVWRPDNYTQPVPIIVDAGPYYEQGQHCPILGQDPCSVPLEDDTITWSSQTTPFNLKNFLPKGYAVAQVAVRGTGTSGGCMDLLGPSEQADLVQAIEHLATQPWSNGNVAMVGASYDGTTPWLVAAAGSPYLKTIVPTAGLPDIYDLMFHNGTAESRGAVMHNQVYWGFGFSDGFPEENVAPLLGSNANGRETYQDFQNLLCPEVVEATAVGQAATHLGGRMSEVSTYWDERDYRQRVLDNYDGSVFLIHGLQDWNVDPHAVMPFNKDLEAAGIPLKQWYGQWGHAFPDSTCGKGGTPEWVVLPCRLDFAEVLDRWFEVYLKDNSTADHGAPVHVQNNLGYWRHDDTYPPADLHWQTIDLATMGGGSHSLNPPLEGAGNIVELRSEPFNETVHLSGTPRLSIPFDVVGQGGQLAAWLFDEDPRGLVRAMNAGRDFETGDWIANPYAMPVVGHAQMNLRYYAGGEEAQVLVPGETYTAKLEMDPLDVQIPPGDRLVLWLFQYQFPDHQAVTTLAPVNIHLDDAVLRLPTFTPDPTTVFPVPGTQFPNETYQPDMYVGYPTLPSTPLPTLPSLAPEPKRIPLELP